MISANLLYENGGLDGKNTKIIKSIVEEKREVITPLEEIFVSGADCQKEFMCA